MHGTNDREILYWVDPLFSDDITPSLASLFVVVILEWTFVESLFIYTWFIRIGGLKSNRLQINEISLVVFGKNGHKQSMPVWSMLVQHYLAAQYMAIAINVSREVPIVTYMTAKLLLE